MSFYGRSESKASVFFLFLLFVTLVITPTLQDRIGTDYISYLTISEDIDYINYLGEKNEFLFYYIYKFIYHFKLDSQVFFFIIASLQILLFINILRFIKRNNNSVLFFFVGFFFITNIYHNQMNHIRSYTAVLFFSNALLYRFERKWVFSGIFIIMSVISHATAMLFLPLILVNRKLSKYINKNAELIIVSVIVIFCSGILNSLASLLITNFFPFYMDYMLIINDSGASIGSIATRLYYCPLIILTLYHLRKSTSNISVFDAFIYAIFILTSTSYLLILQSSVFLRFWEGVVLFYALILASLVVGKSFKFKSILLFYLISPYLFKVVVFPIREYSFNLIVF